MMTDIAKNATELIRIQVSEFKGREYIDVRVWLKPDTPSDEPTPTKKGVAFGRDMLPDIIRTLSELQRQGDGRAHRNPPASRKAHGMGRELRPPQRATA